MNRTASVVVLYTILLSTAHGAVITFEPPYCLTCDAIKRSYEEDGVLLTGFFTHYGMNINGSAINESSGGSRLPSNSYMRIQLSDGGSFSMETVELAEFSQSYEGIMQTITFTGIRSDSTVVTQDFTIDGIIDGKGNLADYELFVFSAEFSNLMYVDVGSTMASIDNITLSPVPAPAALWLFVSGIISLAGLARLRSWHVDRDRGGALPQ